MFIIAIGILVVGIIILVSTSIHARDSIDPKYYKQDFDPLKEIEEKQERYEVEEKYVSMVGFRSKTLSNYSTDALRAAIDVNAYRRMRKMNHGQLA